MENFKLSYKGTKPQKNAKLQKAHWCFSLKEHAFVQKHEKKSKKHTQNSKKKQKKVITYFINST